MNKKNSYVIFAVIAAVILYFLLNRGTVPASSAPVGQPGVGSGGANFPGVAANGLPLFDNTTPPQYVKGLASVSNGTYHCPAGTTPAMNAGDGQVYCVIPANAIAAQPVATPTTGYNAPTYGPTPAQLGTSGTGSTFADPGSDLGTIFDSPQTATFDS